jgi:DNA-binding XRE family transcriptional regulator
MEPVHLRLAEIGLHVAGRYGFALAGGYAVQAHGILHRPSEDIDLFTAWDRRGDFTAAVDAVTYEEARAALLLGQMVHDRRTELAMTQADLAERAGMTQPQLSRLESGGATPTVPLLARLAAALDADLDIAFRPPAPQLGRCLSEPGTRPVTRRPRRGDGLP